MTPLVSVVVPYFNRERTIHRAIRSVLEQTLQDFELIVVDDASDEGLDLVLARYADDGRVRSIRLPRNSGPGAARNAGVATAAGRFIAFLDSDDYWLPEKLRLQHEAVTGAPDPEAVFCVTKTRVVLDRGRELVRPIRLPAPGHSLAEYLYIEGGFAQASAFFLARSLAQRYPFHEDFRQLEDHLFFIEIGTSGASYILVDEVLTVWSNGSIADRASNMDNVQEWTDIVARFKQHAASYLSPKVLLAAEIRLLHNRMWRKSPMKSVKLLQRGVSSGALSLRQATIMMGRNILPSGSYDLARHLLLGQSSRSQKSTARPRLGVATPPDPDAKPYHPERKLPGKRSVLFVTDEPFLPPRNGSQQTYASVARAFNDEGWTTYCISFFRDPSAAASAQLNDAYRDTFTDYLLVPGWNRGGSTLGKVGQFWREANRALTGNVLASHPFLVTKDRAEVTRLSERIRSWNVGSAYVHKVHSMQLLGQVLDALEGVPIILDIHDDCVVRAITYDVVHRELFAVLPRRLIIRDHLSAWLRHGLARGKLEHSRQVEREMLQRCDKILVGSLQETMNYLTDPVLAGKIVFSPVVYDPPAPNDAVTVSGEFDAGFIGSDDTINLHALLYFRDEILPRLRDRLPGLRFLIAGRIVPKARSFFRNVDGVTLWDSLDNIADFYNAVSVSIIPVRHGTGVSIRLLEAMKYGKPVVSTSVGVRGLRSTTFDNVVVTDDPDEFASAISGFARTADAAHVDIAYQSASLPAGT